MHSIIIQMVVMLHVAFGCMFLFMYRQHRAVFSRFMAQSWLLEAFRAAILLSQFDRGRAWSNPVLGLWDCLGVVATWWLLCACADLVGIRLPTRLGRYYIGISVPVILVLRYAVPWGLSGWLGVPADEVGFVSVFIALIIIFVPVTVARSAILYWLFSLWRRERLPGAVLAFIFCVPYVVLAIVSPFQFYFRFDPEWLYFLWGIRVLGFSLGLVMLLFDKQLAAQRGGEVVLRESEAKFHAVFDQSPLPIVLTTLHDGRVADANQAAEKLLGYTRGEMRGRTTIDLQIWEKPEDREGYSQMLQLGTGVNGYEAKLRVKDKSPRNVLFHGRVVTIGGEAYVLNSLLDITDRKQVENALRFRTAFFEAQVDSALDGILVVDSSGKKVLQNRRLSEVWKIPAEVLEDKDDSRQVNFVMSQTKNPQEFVEKVGYLYSHPNEVSRDIIELVDGRILDRYSAPVSDKTGAYYGRIWSFRDVTESRKAEELARHLAAFPELNPNPVLEFNSQGALVYRNPAAVSMAHKVGVAGIEQMLPAGAEAIVAECLLTGKPRLGLETTQGRNKLTWSFYPIAGQSAVHCYVGDITDRESLEEQLRQAQKMEAVGQLAGGVAHDFNNLLTVIMGHLGLLRSDAQLTPEIDESLSEISAAANRAAKLTHQLLAFSRRQVLSTSALDLNEVVTHLTKMLRRVLGEHVSMQLDFASEQLIFLGDTGLMEQVLVNLAVNARDAMPDGGTLKITTREVTRTPPSTKEDSSSPPAGPFIQLSVGDTGSGIPPEIQSKIFEPFFTTKEVGKGTGLGLATVFGIVQQHRGWIEVESELGQGATFHIFLPRLAAALPEESRPRETSAALGRNELVLLVEDETAVREMGTQALRRQGYRVITAPNGRAALEMWAQHKDDVALLLTDMIMPEGVSGRQLAKQLVEEKPTLKVIYTSGYNAEIAGKEVKLKDGINYLAKPYDLERLFRTVREALDGQRSRSPFGK
jgi:PAS domain S-box-containing protein